MDFIMEKEAERAKNVRHAAKSPFTQTINTTTQLLLDAKRPPSEICDEFEKVKVVHTDLIKKHAAYTMFPSDKEYPEAENWMEECSFKYVDFSIHVNVTAKVTPSMFKRKMRHKAQPALKSST